MGRSLGGLSSGDGRRGGEVLEDSAMIRVIEWLDPLHGEHALGEAAPKGGAGFALVGVDDEVVLKRVR